MNARDIFGVWMSPETGKRFVIRAAGIEFFSVEVEGYGKGTTYTKSDVIALIERWGWVKQGVVPCSGCGRNLCDMYMSWSSDDDEREHDAYACGQCHTVLKPAQVSRIHEEVPQ